MSDLHVKVARDIYDRRAEFLKDPVTLTMSDPQEDCGIELILTHHPKLWLVTGGYQLYVVRAHTADEAIRRAWLDDHDVEGDVRCTAEDYSGGPSRDARDVLTATELTLQGNCGVVVDATG